MVNLLHLNDGELNMNLETRMGLDLGYCYCGNTCVTINLFYDQKGFPKHLKKVSHRFCRNRQEISIFWLPVTNH